MTDDLVERVARAIANENGDDLDTLPKNKSEWIKKRGMSAGRFRDCNEPRQTDYLEMARAAIAECFKWHDIKDAPRDGTVFLAMAPWWGHANTCAFQNNKMVAIWDGKQAIEYMGDFGTDYRDATGATHYMPLPKGPEEER